MPLAPFRSVLRLERRISREGMVRVGGNAYSVPDATRRRLVEVHTLANEVRILRRRADCCPSGVGRSPSAPRRTRTQNPSLTAAIAIARQQ
ncbi:Mu transposase domain-containing protein [Mesorhizobium amorphae]|uniref:Mu transposase domain-containing protein n=1 Tax=Mesorhizobium amorphae TaxID=71433 RepID=UPI003D671BAD